MKKIFRRNNISYYGKEVYANELFLAKNDKQLGICLRMLYADDIQPFVKTVMNEKGKIEFHVKIQADDSLFQMLDERYKVPIS